MLQLGEDLEPVLGALATVMVGLFAVKQPLLLHAVQ
jgi:hypothetical protein